MNGYYIDMSGWVKNGWLTLRDKNNMAIGEAHANNYEARYNLNERLKELNNQPTNQPTNEL
jgi:hypothetical protein